MKTEKLVTFKRAACALFAARDFTIKAVPGRYPEVLRDAPGGNAS